MLTPEPSAQTAAELFPRQPGVSGEPSPRQLKALHIISDTNIGGAGRQLLNFLKYYDRGLLDVQVLCPVGSLLAPRCAELDTVVTEMAELPADESLAWQSLRRQLPAIISHIKENHIQVVHTHASFAGRLAARIAGVGCLVYTKHWLDPLTGRRGLKGRGRNLINNLTCDRIIAVSEAVRENLIRQGLPPGKIEVIYNGVDPEVFRPSGRNSQAGEAERVVGMVGRLSPEKGHRCFLEAAGIILNKAAGVTFMIVGAGALEQELRRFCRELGIEGRVVFTGLRDDIPSLLEQFDVLVQPSLSEAQSLSLVEGMCMARPCVASRVGGIKEVVRDGVDGLLATPGDSQELAEKILFLLNNQSEARRLGEAAARSAAGRFDARIMAEKISDLYIQCYNRK